MRFMDVRELSIMGKLCVVTRSGYTGEDGFEISIPSDVAREIAEGLLENPDVAPVGLAARDTLRLEAGLCLYGADIDAGTTPVMAGLTWAIQPIRRHGGERVGEFPGAPIILDELERGPAIHRVGLAPEGRMPVRAGTPLFVEEAGEAPVGHVTSGGFGPSLGRPIAMGYVPHGPVGARNQTVRRSSRQAAAGDSHAPSLCPAPLQTQLSSLPNKEATLLKFTKDHEWLKIDGDVATVGITAYAAEQLGDLVFVQLPEIGTTLDKGQEVAVVESVKTASDVYAPLAGEVVEINEAVVNDPSIVNSDPEKTGWFFKPEARRLGFPRRPHR